MGSTFSRKWFGLTHLGRSEVEEEFHTSDVMTTCRVITVAPREDPFPQQGSESQGELAWFNIHLKPLARGGMVTVRMFRKFAKDMEQTFAAKWFSLLDKEGSGKLSIQVVIGGLSRLASHERRLRLLKWLEDGLADFCTENLLITPDRLRRFFLTKGTVEKLFGLTDVDGDGRIPLQELLGRLSLLPNIDNTAKYQAWLEYRFGLIVGPGTTISMERFKAELKSQQHVGSFLAEQLFHVLNKDGSSELKLSDLMAGLSCLLTGSEEEKARLLFQVYDVNGNGSIDRGELKLVLSSCMEEGAFSDDQISDLTEALFEDADSDCSGAITYIEFLEEMSRQLELLDCLALSVVYCAEPVLEVKAKSSPLLGGMLSVQAVRNHLRTVVAVALYVVLNVALLCYAAIQYQPNVAMIVAKGCGQCLNLNSMFALLLMLRKMLSYMRSTPVGRYLPLDQHIAFHKVIGVMILVFSLLHTIAHVYNFVKLTETTPHTLMEYMLGTNLGIGWVSGSASMTGWVLLWLLLVITLSSTSLVRNSGHFQWFYWIHQLTIPWFVLLVIHAESFWLWLLLPGLFYVIERVLRTKMARVTRYGHMSIQQGIVLPSKVVHVVVSRPRNFKFQPGDYVYLCVPAIAAHEWHPFTISSAPEQDGTLWFHIRAVGTWTSRLYGLFEQHTERLRQSTPQQRYDSLESIMNSNSLGSGVLPEIQRSSSSHFTSTSDPSGDSEYKNVFTLAPTKPRANKVSRDSGVYLCETTNVNIADGTRKVSDTASVLVAEGMPPMERNDSRMSCSSLGQDFSHMFRPPTVVNLADGFFDTEFEVYMDGPYGAPSTRIFEAEHAVLVGAGIGVTPFASILQSIVHRYRRARQTCPRCRHAWTAETHRNFLTLKKVDFFWINRDHKSFEWFISLLSQLEIEQSEMGNFERNFLEMHMYMTSMYGRTDSKAIGLRMAMYLTHKKEKRDLITGLKTRTQAGRPDWDKVFRRLDAEKCGKVTVFFCGSAQLGKVLQKKCMEHGFEFCQENFS
ncbi:NADPH oxidase 5-like [Branchiostoma floridae]|uniref:NADPH oxidase 5-like n=1 Tax=Branchiostoma floridae TaxID=7739 RepID=A0A9J7MGY8_BRAFL|nr:NADPH oxidase 5-like [Branchiostoma floridae]XP_035699931.1 NADPH oxidase 5-like [Branchiostoma floridae]